MLSFVIFKLYILYLEHLVGISSSSIYCISMTKRWRNVFNINIFFVFFPFYINFNIKSCFLSILMVIICYIKIVINTKSISFFLNFNINMNPLFTIWIISFFLNFNIDMKIIFKALLWEIIFCYMICNTIFGTNECCFYFCEQKVNLTQIL